MQKLFSGSLLLILFSLFVINSCSSDDERMTCFTPPEPIVFAFLDNAGNNLIENGTLSVSQIKVREIVDENTQYPINFNQIQNKIVLQEIGFSAGTKHYTLSSPLVDFEFAVTSSEITGSCSGYRIDEVNFNGVVPESDGYTTFVIRLDVP